MPRLHILQGGIDNGDRDWLIRAAKQNLVTRRWITPKSARAGDQAVIYVAATFFATGTISGKTARRPDWGPRAYGTGLNGYPSTQERLAQSNRTSRRMDPYTSPILRECGLREHRQPLFGGWCRVHFDTLDP